MIDPRYLAEKADRLDRMGDDLLFNWRNDVLEYLADKKSDEDAALLFWKIQQCRGEMLSVECKLRECVVQLTKLNQGKQKALIEKLVEDTKKQMEDPYKWQS